VEVGLPVYNQNRVEEEEEEEEKEKKNGWQGLGGGQPLD